LLILRRIFVRKKEHATEEQTKLHHLYFSSNVIRIIKIKIGWARHIAHIGPKMMDQHYAARTRCHASSMYFASILKALNGRVMEVQRLQLKSKQVYVEGIH
jgi:hypothetical protein